MGHFTEIKDNLLVEAAFSLCVFVYTVYCFPELKLNGEWSGDLSWGASTPPNHSVTDPSHPSVYFLVFLFHLTPFSPTTCLSKPSQLSLCPSLCYSSYCTSSVHFLISHRSLALIPATLGLQLLCQCFWLKCSPWRNKICEKNFIVSFSDKLAPMEKKICVLFCVFSSAGGFWLQSPCFSQGVSGSRHGSSCWWII